MDDHKPDLLELFLHGKPEVSHQKTLKPVQKKIELKKRPPAPDPSQLKLIVVTCGAFLNSNINLDLIARRLPLDDQIKGKKLLGVVEEGEIKTKAKNYHSNQNVKKKTSARKDFSN